MPNSFLLQLMCACSREHSAGLESWSWALTGKQKASVDRGMIFSYPAKCLLHVLRSWRKLENGMTNLIKRFSLTFKVLWENEFLRCMLDEKDSDHSPKSPHHLFSQATLWCFDKHEKVLSPVGVLVWHFL